MTTPTQPEEKPEEEGSESLKGESLNEILANLSLESQVEQDCAALREYANVAAEMFLTFSEVDMTKPQAFNLIDNWMRPVILHHFPSPSDPFLDEMY